MSPIDFKAHLQKKQKGCCRAKDERIAELERRLARAVESFKVYQPWLRERGYKAMEQMNEKLTREIAPERQ